ncbi:MAG: carotenoid biosynthesis protein, partial [Candidatus Hydrogenedentales bacterium]
GPLDYWKWAHAGAYYGIPWTNFAGWLLVSFIALAVAGNTQGAPAGNTHTPNRGARTIGLSIVAFFALTALANGLYIPATIGISLCTLDLANTRMSSQRPVSVPGDFSNGGRVF